eukprot:scaffold16305_cov124-Isochrysis_galbana.AAC.11
MPWEFGLVQSYVAGDVNEPKVLVVRRREPKAIPHEARPAELILGSMRYVDHRASLSKTLGLRHTRRSGPLLLLLSLLLPGPSPGRSLTESWFRKTPKPPIH